MPTTTQQENHLSDLAREMDSPAAVIWTSIHVMKRCLEKITHDADGTLALTDVTDSDSAVSQLRKSMDLAVVAGERLVRINRTLNRPGFFGVSVV